MNQLPIYQYAGEIEGTDAEALARYNALMEKTVQQGLDRLPFKHAFALSREMGVKEFTWRNKRYTTELENQPKKERTGSADNVKIRKKPTFVDAGRNYAESQAAGRGTPESLPSATAVRRKPNFEAAASDYAESQSAGRGNPEFLSGPTMIRPITFPSTKAGLEMARDLLNPNISVSPSMYQFEIIKAMENLKRLNPAKYKAIKEEISNSSLKKGGQLNTNNNMNNYQQGGTPPQQRKPILSDREYAELLKRGIGAQNARQYMEQNPELTRRDYLNRQQGLRDTIQMDYQIPTGSAIYPQPAADAYNKRYGLVPNVPGYNFRRPILEEGGQLNTNNNMNYYYQEGGQPMPPEAAAQGAPQGGGNPEEEIAMQILQAFQQLSPEMQQQLMQAMAEMMQQGAQPQARRGGYYRRGGIVNPYKRGI